MNIDLNVETPPLSVTAHFAVSSCFVLTIALVYSLSVAVSDLEFENHIAPNIIAAQETFKQVRKQTIEWIAVPAVAILTAALRSFGVL